MTASAAPAPPTPEHEGMPVTTPTPRVDLPRLALLDSAPTPLVELRTLGAPLGSVRILVKRDDLGGIGAGGNKLRKLQYAVGAAHAEGADTLLTFGALQSNHARLTAAVAASCGMECELFLSRRVPRRDPAYESSGNLLLARLFGATVHEIAPEADAVALAAARVDALRASGRRPWVIPFGGSDATGALGYVDCATELVAQCGALGLGGPDHVIVASGSGGTQAGLVAGFHAAGTATRVHGVSVLHPAAALAAIVRRLAAETCARLGHGAPPDAQTEVDDRFVGAGYGVPTDAAQQAIRRLARAEGIVLDPVYTGKAFAGLLALAASGRFAPGATVVFVHTGGLPGVFAYAPEFAPESAPAPAGAAA
jgi:D-cysteine desulfhydrase family pyridoxal phosphate-dependent enzyme